MIKPKKHFCWQSNRHHRFKFLTAFDDACVVFMKRMTMPEINFQGISVIDFDCSDLDDNESVHIVVGHRSNGKQTVEGE